MALPDFEKLASFYLGKVYEPARGEVTDELVLYDAKDLTTHAVCVGMTGSGKTGLCLSLLEEAAIDGIPAIAIDPKGDLGNLLLTFPDLKPSDFEPWIEPEAAARKGLTVPQYARKTADTWRKGLAAWGEDGERIQRFRDAVDLTIYTPGSNAGVPLKILKSFAAPPPALRDDGDALRERVMVTASGLCSLLGVDADPVQSREHILLSTLLDRAWSEGRDLDVTSLIREIQDPPFDRIGVMDLESIYPAKERFALAMRLNNLIASPGFQSWMQGEPLDVQRLLYTPEGKPRLSIVSIAHLDDSERMFFVTMLLNEVVSWMRGQPGSSSLRAILYMDEVFGFLPPTANPPSKTPMLTLLKQARAYGLGVVLASQNPVDLDYKALSNAGTWFLGRLQTERDKMRVLDGLEGASTASGQGFDRARTEAILSGLSSRVFLMNNVHEDAPEILQTRWALSYLRGPLTRDQIATLMADKKAARAPAAGATTKTTRKGAADVMRPVLAPEVPETFIARTFSLPPGATLLYRPALLARTRAHYTRATYHVDTATTTVRLRPLTGREVPADPWPKAEVLGTALPDTEETPEAGARFSRLPAQASLAKSYTAWKKALVNHVYRDEPLVLWRSKPHKMISTVGETEGDFRQRLVQEEREHRDLEVEKLRAKHAKEAAKLGERIRKAEQRVDVERTQYESAKTSALISLGQTILGALFGRKTLSRTNVGKAGTTVRGAGRAYDQRQDIERAQENVEALRGDLLELEGRLATDVAALEVRIDPAQFELDELSVRAKKSEIEVEPLTLAWVPWELED